MKERLDITITVRGDSFDGPYSRDVLATPIGKFLAVHIAVDGVGFMVTHRPTGYVAVLAETRELAIEAAKSLECEDWNFDKPILCPAASMAAGKSAKAKYEQWL